MVMARTSPQSKQCLRGVVVLMAVILINVVDAKGDCLVPTAHQPSTLPSVATPTTHQPSTLPSVATPTTHQPSTLPSVTTPTPTQSPTAGERCWRQIQQVNEKENRSYSLSECEEFCGNIIVKEIQVDWVRLTPNGDQGIKCLMEFLEIYDRISPDLFWFTSSESDVLLYMGNSTVVVTWDYLTREEKVLEAVFLLVALVALTVTLVGNLLVVATVVSISDKMNPWMIVRTSLAITDLLRGIFVMTLAIYNCLCLMTSSLSSFDLNISTKFLETLGIMYEPLIIRTGYSSFCAIVFEITSVTSLQCLALLTLERLLICNYIRAEKLLKSYRINIVVMWLIAIALPLMIFWGDKSCTSFDPVTKLTFLLPSEAGFGVSQTTFLIQKTYLFALFFFTVVGSAQTMRTFHIRSKEELIEQTKHSPMTQVKQQKMDDRYIMRSMKLMLVAYLASVLPYFFLLIPGLKRQIRFLYFVFWWVFILSSSWNWYLYNLRSTFFRNQVARLVLSFPWLPAALEERLRAVLLSTSALNPDWGPVWHELDKLIRKQSSDLKQSRIDPEKAKTLEHSFSV